MKSLEETRKSAGYSQSEFSKLLGIAQSTYCQYERGKRAVPVEVAKRICQKLNVAEAEIFLPKMFTVSKCG